VQCAGSRDASIGVPYCSRVCCMYAIKQAMLLSGALPIADITIYYMDIRAFGKGYEQFYQNAKAMGVSFVRGKVARIKPLDDGDLSLHVETTEDAEHPGHHSGVESVRCNTDCMFDGWLRRYANLDCAYAHDRAGNLCRRYRGRSQRYCRHHYGGRCGRHAGEPVPAPEASRCCRSSCACRIRIYRFFKGKV